MFSSFKIKLIEKVRGKNALRWLGFLSFAESSFFPIPPDFLLMPMTLAEPTRWRKYATVTTVTSVLGGLAGYAIGALLWGAIGVRLVSVYHLENELITVGHYFNGNAFWTIFTAAFTPIPYKLFTIAGGLFHINVPIFVVASFLGRGMRFYVVSYLMKVFGARFGDLAFKYFNILSAIFAILVVLLLLLQFFK